MMKYDMISYDVMRYDMTLYDMIRYDIIRQDMIKEILSGGGLFVRIFIFVFDVMVSVMRGATKGPPAIFFLFFML